jgi:hypothetical protein
MLEHGVGLGE